MNLKRLLIVCLVSFSSSVDLLSVPRKTSTLNVDVTKLVGNEGLINSTGIRDLITTNSTSLVEQMAKADPKQVEDIIALLKPAHDNSKKALTNLADQVSIINKVIIQLTGLIRVTWYTDGVRKTYADIKKSCESKGKRLCYYKEICPKKGFMIRKKFNHDRWTPIVISHNDPTPNWVQIGSANHVCQLITVHHPVKGNYWINSKAYNEGRRYYSCCT